MDKAERIVSAIIDDLKDWSGLGREWWELDALERSEIREAWLKIIKKELAKED